jgi:hypothetical protein
MKALLFALATLLALLHATGAGAHKPSDSYLALDASNETVAGHWDIALRDLDLVLDLDRNSDHQLDWGEIRARFEAIDAYATSRLALAVGDAACPVAISDHRIDHHSDGAYLVLGVSAHCPTTTDSLTIDYRLLFDIDAQHRGLLRLSGAGATQTAVFAKEHARQTLVLAGSNAWHVLRAFVRDGIAHIATGYDHILFLVALLLPAVFGREGRRWTGLPRLPLVAWNVAATVTAFTIAHSITLSLATLHVVQLPARFTESMIALSVLVTAIDNLVPILPARRWIVAFTFGLMHGFGFASVLLDLDLSGSMLALSLFGFNLGVELGQLAIVAVVVPLACVARSLRGYRVGVVGGGSIAIAILAFGWLVERSLDVKMMPF